eukprot:Opistho-1_new@74061
MSRLLICAFPLLLLPAAAMAQDHDSELRITGSAKIAVADPTDIEFESINRFSDDSGGLYEIELAGGLAQEVAKGVTIGGAYVRVVNYSRGTVTRTEDRFRVQLGLAGNAGPFKLSGRMRLEHRSRSDGDDTGYRLRPQIKAALPLGKSDFSLVGSHESLIVLNDTDWGEKAGYDRMRNMIGVSWKASKLLSIEAGYLNQYRFVRGSSRDTMDHALSVSVGLSL